MVQDNYVIDNVIINEKRSDCLAVADREIDPRILKYARNEFLNYGFEKASLKSICAQAGVTTGALYKRYTGKDDLFCAVVKQTVDDLMQVIKEKMKKDISEMSDQELIKVWEMDEGYLLWWFDYLYQRYEPFIHGMNKEQIEEHCKIVCRFFNWHECLGFQQNT